MPVTFAARGPIALPVEGGDTPPTDVATLFGADLIGWYVAGNWNTISGGEITQWNDLSGNGKHLTNTGTVPYSATGLNSRPAVVGDGSGYMNNTAFNGWGTQTGACAFFFVGQLGTGIAEFSQIAAFYGHATLDSWDNNNSVSWGWTRQSSDRIETTCNSANKAQNNLSLDTSYRYLVANGSADWASYVNNVSGGSSNNTAVVFTGARTEIRVGIDWLGPISEIGFVKRTPSLADRNSLDGLLTTRWGL